MELTERVQRPLLAGVVFFDIVGYSRWQVETQFAIKKHFNRHIATTISSYPTEERLILDTGDGAAVCFFHRPERGLHTAVQLRRPSQLVSVGVTTYALRTGIHVGPVRVIRDLNGQLNVVGDGINDAQRVMSFASASEILVSKAFYDVVSQARPDYAGLFAYRGPYRDKHSKEHILFEVRAEMSDAPPAASRQVVTASVSNASGAGQVPSPEARWAPDAALIESTQGTLARIMGPVASAIVRRAAQSATSVSEFHMRIAASIDSDDDRMTFLTLVGAIRSKRE